MKFFEQFKTGDKVKVTSSIRDLVLVARKNQNAEITFLNDTFITLKFTNGTEATLRLFVVENKIEHYPVKEKIGKSIDIQEKKEKEEVEVLEGQLCIDDYTLSVGDKIEVLEDIFDGNIKKGEILKLQNFGIEICTFSNPTCFITTSVKNFGNGRTKPCDDMSYFRNLAFRVKRDIVEANYEENYKIRIKAKEIKKENYTSFKYTYLEIELPYCFGSYNVEEFNHKDIDLYVFFKERFKNVELIELKGEEIEIPKPFKTYIETMNTVNKANSYKEICAIIEELKTLEKKVKEAKNFSDKHGHYLVEIYSGLAYAVRKAEKCEEFKERKEELIKAIGRTKMGEK